MVKQASIQTCICGQAVKFPEGEIKTTCCQCGAIWECGTEGYWYTEIPSTAPFAPILAKPVVCSVKSREQKYANYPKSRRKKRKAGKRC